MYRGDTGNGSKFGDAWEEGMGRLDLREAIWRRMPEPLSASQAKAFLFGVSSYRHVLCVLMILCTGMRVSEVVNLQLGDLHFDTRQITIRTKAMTRIVPMPEALIWHLLPYVELHFSKREPHVKLFGNMSCMSVPIVLKKASRECGFPFEVTSQVLRSTFVTSALAAGITWGEIATVLGWCPSSEKWDQIGREFGFSDDVKSES